MFGNLFKRNKGPFNLHIEGYGKPIVLDDKKFILQAALDEGIPIPYSCRVGGCGTCKVQLLEGKVKEFTDKTYLLTAEELQQNYILSCQSMPRSDVRIRVDNLDLSEEARATIHHQVTSKGVIKQLRPLTHDILELTVELDGPLEYTAGEYADIRVPGVIEEIRSYSFARKPDPSQPNICVFHVRRVPGGQFTEWLHSQNRVGATLELKGPQGNFWLRKADAPMVCIAGGSGMAPIKAMLEQAVADGVKRDCVYLFGARTQKDLYCLAEMEEIKRNWQGKFEFIPVLSEEPEDSDWLGRRGFVTEYLEKDVPNLAAHHVYMCGPPPMLDAATVVLKKAGISPDHIHSDKFLDKSHLAKTR